MSFAVDKLIGSMPYPILTKIEGVPSYEDIKILNDELTSNAVTVTTNLGGGLVGYARLTLTEAVYANICPHPWVPPDNPGTQAAIPAGSTGPQITALNRAFDKNFAIYADFIAVGNALKKQLLAAVDDIYLCTLKMPYIGYGNVTVLELLTHLYSTYAKISPGDLEANEKRMKAAYDPNLPIEFLFKQIEDAVAYADHGQAPISQVQVTNRAINLIINTGLFADDCKEWKRLPAESKTWLAFKVKFAEAHQEWRESQATTTSAHFGNNMLTTQSQTHTANAISELAAATAADRATMVALTTSVQTLTAQLTSTQAQLVSALAELAAINKNNSRGITRDRNRSTNPYGKGRHYCWSCGFDCDHSSSTCPNKKPGHVDHVNRFNTKGGSQANKK